MGALENKVIVVTGAARGIGKAEALFFAHEGARVVVVDNGAAADGNGEDATLAFQVVEEIKRFGGEALGMHESVVDAASAERVIQKAAEVYGRLDGVVSNAGILREGIVQKTSDADLTAVFAVHVRGAFGLLRAAARVLIDQKEGGSIILTSGPVGFFGSIRQSALAAASGALFGLTRTAAAELKRHDVRVNALAPTARTRQTEELPMFKSIREDSMSPEHVAPIAGYLLSDLSKDVTGEILGVAGARAYAFRTRETAGAFSENRPFTIDEVAGAFRDIVKAST